MAVIVIVMFLYSFLFYRFVMGISPLNCVCLVSWAFNIDKGNVNEVVFLDLKKAFDKVDFSTFLSTSYSYGIRNSSFNWFKSYLNLRKQKCIVNGSPL